MPCAARQPIGQLATRASCGLGRLAFGLVLPLFLPLVIAGCEAGSDASGGMPPPPSVGVLPIVQADIQPESQFSGRVEAIDSVALRPQVSGPISRIAFTEGALVKRGQLLFQIDPRPFAAERDRAAAVLTAAKAQAQLAETEAARARQLLAERAGSQQALEQAEATLAVRKADVQAAEAALAFAQLQLGYTAVRSPITGRASRALITVGNLASPDQVLTEIVSQDPIYVRFDLNEAALVSLSALQRTQGEQRATVALPLAGNSAAPNQSGQRIGTVVFIDNRLNPQTGAATARVRLDNPDGALVPGMSAKVQLPIGGTQTALLVPEAAVVTDQDRRLVYTVDASGMPTPVPVTLGSAKDGRRAVIGEGLAADQLVIVEGLLRVFPGMPVSPTRLDMPDDANAADRPALTAPEKAVR